jgi:DNA-binding CsgD family transcriptional regulator
MMLTRARAMILLADAGTDEPPDPAFLRDTLGLTLGEARVAALIGRGMAPKAAAERLGIAESTARTVLKRVFIKIGVSRQSELTAFLNRIATFAAGKGNI